MQIEEQERVRAAVRERYARVALGCGGAGQGERGGPGRCCGSGPVPEPMSSGGCGCGPSGGTDLSDTRLQALLGYDAGDLAGAPEGANLGLGCGNPVAMASMKAGETVVDLGSGGGFDCFIAAKRVGALGRVIGVDMTAEMVARARRNARAAGVANVDFRLGEIEHLPVADGSADIIISNCVINLSVDKAQVFRDALRVLKPGGRLAVSDIVATQPLPPRIRKDLEMVSACVGGAATVEETRVMLESAGFGEIRIEANPGSRKAIEAYAPGSGAGAYVVAAYISAFKPAS
jgi:arsenite methyltransferase